MDHPVADEPITCASCEYRYSRSQANCPMCGTAAPVVEPLQAVSTLAEESRPSSSDGQPRFPYTGLRKLIPIAVVLVALMVVGLFLYTVRKRNLRTESGSADQPTVTSPQPKLENVGQRHIVHNPVRGVQHVVAAKPGAAETKNAANENDPVELWKAVKRGNVSAEVTLANLYLEGKSLPQNCVQAHTLLHAASMKGSKAADTLLKSSYAERCE